MVDKPFSFLFPLGPSSSHGRVRETLAAKRSVLDALACLLIETEVVDAEGLRKLLAA